VACRTIARRLQLRGQPRVGNRVPFRIPLRGTLRVLECAVYRIDPRASQWRLAPPLEALVEARAQRLTIQVAADEYELGSPRAASPWPQHAAVDYRIPLNAIGGPVQITTGRRLGAAPELESTDTVVMLDGECAFLRVSDPEVRIYWGAYLLRKPTTPRR